MKKRILLSYFLSLFSLITQNTLSFKDCLFIKNDLVSNLIREQIKRSNETLPCIDYKNMALVIIENLCSKAVISFPVLSDRYKFIKKVTVLLEICGANSQNDILESITSEQPRKNFNYKVLNFKVQKPNGSIGPYVGFNYMKNNLGLKNYIDFEKDGRVYYTVPSEDKLDDIHMVYESGNERKEFVFTNSPEKPIVPVEEVEKLGKKPEVKPKKTIMSQISSFFGFFTKHEEVKNEGYDYVDEHTKLKEKIY